MPEPIQTAFSRMAHEAQQVQEQLTPLYQNLADAITQASRELETFAAKAQPLSR